MGPTDSHTDIIALHKLVEANGNGTGRGASEVQIVKFEIVPPNGDSTRPLDEWNVIVDQDILPEWFVESVDKERAREALRRSGVIPLYVDYRAKHASLDADYRAKRTLRTKWAI
jgi:hypothetical protein